jgi:hypothetical protein
MEKDTVKTKVIFRVFKCENKGEVIAIFPEIPTSIFANHCESYMNIGQHSACDPIGIVSMTKLAKPEEYANLKAELENSYGYNLEIIQKNTKSHYRKRVEEIERRRAK